MDTRDSVSTEAPRAKTKFTDNLPLMDASHDGGSFSREIARRSGQRNDTASRLDFNPEDMDKLRDVLTRMGMRKFDDKSYRSSFSFVMDGPDNQIIRVRHKSIEYNARPYCLKPIHQVEVGNYMIDILPRVNMDATQQDAETLFKAAAKDGYLFWDIRDTNMGRLNDGTPVVLDADAVVPMSQIEDFVPGASINFGNALLKYAKVSKNPAMHALKSHDDIKAFAHSTDPDPYDWDEKQKAHMESLGLKAGMLNGAFDAQEIARLRNALTERVPLPQSHPAHESIITGVILDGGYTKKEFGDIAEAATKQVADGKTTNWREALIEEHIKFQDAQSKAPYR